MPDSDQPVYYDEDSEDTEASPLTNPLLDSIARQPPAKDKQVKERVWIVAMCSFIASLSSLGGMAAPFTSPALLELSNANLTIPTQRIERTSILFSVFGVSLEDCLRLHLTL